jgi:peroxiredoxin Q/BCP
MIQSGSGSNSVSHDVTRMASNLRNTAPRRIADIRPVLAGHVGRSRSHPRAVPQFWQRGDVFRWVARASSKPTHGALRLPAVQVQKRQKKGRKMVEAGSKAPDFKLPGDGGEDIKLSSFKGQPVVVYFYPKDDTPGCTKEAIAFSGLIEEFAAAGAAVIGISPDGAAKHDKFIAKHDLKVRLAADEENKTAEAYGVWVEKSMYGKKYMGVERSTFLVDAKGKVAQVWRKVKVPGHAEAVLDAVKAL